MMVGGQPEETVMMVEEEDGDSDQDNPISNRKRKKASCTDLER